MTRSITTVNFYSVVCLSTLKVHAPFNFKNAFYLTAYGGFSEHVFPTDVRDHASHQTRRREFQKCKFLLLFRVLDEIEKITACWKTNFVDTQMIFLCICQVNQAG
jgi:hypothetical protein